MTHLIKNFIESQLTYFSEKRIKLMRDESLLTFTVVNEMVMQKIRNLQKLNWAISLCSYALELSDEQFIDLFNFPELELDLVKSFFSEEHNQWNQQFRVFFICKLAEEDGLELSPNLGCFCANFTETFRGL